MKSLLPRVQNWITTAMLIAATYSAVFSANIPQSFVLNCPPNVYVSCTAELWNLSIYGNATYSLNYYTYSAGSPTVTYYLNSCNIGYIKRTWSVEDPYWNIQTCTQYIYVSSNGSGQPTITWPKDIELEGCNPNTNPNVLPAGFNYPSWVSSECAMLGRSYSDMLFTVNSQCKKIMRTWKVLDWCNGSTSNGFATYSSVQIIKIITNEPPTLNCPPQIVINSTNCKNAELVTSPLTIDPSVCGGNFEITNNSVYATSKGNNISGTYPIGTTKVTYTVKYGCGKLKVCTTNVVVNNANKPTPYCVGSLITALMPVDTDNDGKIDNGMVDLWAKDLDRGSKSLCGYSPLRFSFSKDSIVMNKRFTCDNIGKNQVPIYVFDTKGAYAYCITEIIIQNNGANIPDCHPAPPPPPPVPTYQVRGTVFSVSDAKLVDANVNLRYNQPITTYTFRYDTTTILQLDSFYNYSGYKLYRYIEVKKVTERKDSTVQYLEFNTRTNNVGQYRFDGLVQRGKPLTIRASYSDPKKKGIDSRDVELLTKYLLGEVTFNSYPQFLAADIDENGIIDIQDQNALMAFVTGAVDTLPGKTQWYMMDAKAVYTPAASILSSPLKNFVTLDSISKDSNVVNFVGIKKGNISVDPNTVNDSHIDTRAKGDAFTKVGFYPNPFVGDIMCEIYSKENGIATIQLISPSGQMLQTSRRSVVAGQNNIVLKADDIPSGMIIYRVVVGDQLYTGQLTKID